MKRIILALAMVLPMSAAAQEQHHCVGAGDLAEVAMKARQAGMPMSSALDGQGNDVVRKIIMGAYDKPRFMTQTHKRQAVQNYRIEWERRCYRAE